MNPNCLLMPVIVLALTGSVVFAQTTALDAGGPARLDLSKVQKQTVYQSVTKTQKNNAAPPSFRATIGAIVPASIALVPMTETIANLIPQTKGLEVGLVEGQVVLVEPQSKKVVTVIVE
jgi:hypothetical protein